MSDFSFCFDENEMAAMGPPAPVLAPLPVQPVSNAATRRMPAQLERRNILSFPLKLHVLLSDATKMGFEDIVSWQPSTSGQTYFKVHKPEEFASRIMRAYFNQTKWKSFQRQLNLYGFVRIHQGPLRGSYHHRLFVRGQPSLTRMMQRGKPANELMATAQPSVPIRADGVTVSGQGKLKSLKPDPSSSSQEETSDEILLFKEFFENSENYHLEENDGMSMNGTLEDMSNDQDPFGDDEAATRAVQESRDDVAKEDHFIPVQERSFPWKLYELLENADKPESNFANVVSWDENGRSFTIYDHQAFLDTIMPLYFDQTSFESCRRQLNLYGFSRVGRGKATSTYFHPCFVRGDRELCRQVVRRTSGRRSVQDGQKQRARVTRNASRRLCIP